MHAAYHRRRRTAASWQANSGVGGVTGHGRVGGRVQKDGWDSSARPGRAGPCRDPLQLLPAAGGPGPSSSDERSGRAVNRHRRGDRRTRQRGASGWWLPPALRACAPNSSHRGGASESEPRRYRPGALQLLQLHCRCMQRPWAHASSAIKDSRSDRALESAGSCGTSASCCWPSHGVRVRRAARRPGALAASWSGSVHGHVGSGGCVRGADR